MSMNNNLKNKISKQVEQKQSHSYREQFDGSQVGRRVEGWVKNVMALRSTN